MIFRLKRPSKNPVKLIIGMGLLLDANQIPIGIMKMYPRNEKVKTHYTQHHLMILKTQSHIRQNDLGDRG